MPQSGILLILKQKFNIHFKVYTRIGPHLCEKDEENPPVKPSLNYIQPTWMLEGRKKFQNTRYCYFDIESTQDKIMEINGVPVCLNFNIYIYIHIIYSATSTLQICWWPKLYVPNVLMLVLSLAMTTKNRPQIVAVAYLVQNFDSWKIWWTKTTDGFYSSTILMAQKITLWTNSSIFCSIPEKSKQLHMQFPTMVENLTFIFCWNGYMHDKLFQLWS
jgi:hypothetical protein